jgi:hypothetical protein
MKQELDKKEQQQDFGPLREHAQERFAKNNMSMPTFLEQFVQQGI